MCEQDCLMLCKYLDHWTGRKCVNRMIAHVSFYRDFGGDTAGKRKVVPIPHSGSVPSDIVLRQLRLISLAQSVQRRVVT